MITAHVAPSRRLDHAEARRLARLRSTDGRVLLRDLTDDQSDPPATAVRGAPDVVEAMETPVDPRVGLVVRFDDPEVHDRGDGRRQRSACGWEVRDLERLGADAVWLSVWWHPDAGRPVRHGQEKFAEIVGHDTAQHRLPLIVEPRADGRPLAGDATPERELAVARHAVGRFADRRFGAGLLAVPCPADRVVNDISPSTLRQHFVQIDQLIDGPWLVSSGDASPAVFSQVAELARTLGSLGTAGPIA